MISPGVLIATVVCATIVYLGRLMHKFYVNKADETIDMLCADIMTLQTNETSVGSRLSALEAQCKKLLEERTKAALGKIR